MTLDQGAAPGDTTATIRVFVKPMILWLWIGGADHGDRHPARGVPRFAPADPDRPGVGTDRDRADRATTEEAAAGTVDDVEERSGAPV